MWFGFRANCCFLVGWVWVRVLTAMDPIWSYHLCCSGWRFCHSALPGPYGSHYAESASRWCRTQLNRPNQPIAILGKLWDLWLSWENKPSSGGQEWRGVDLYLCPCRVASVLWDQFWSITAWLVNKSAGQPQFTGQLVPLGVARKSFGVFLVYNDMCLVWMQCECNAIWQLLARVLLPFKPKE